MFFFFLSKYLWCFTWLKNNHSVILNHNIKNTELVRRNSILRLVFQPSRWLSNLPVICYSLIEEFLFDLYIRMFPLLFWYREINTSSRARWIGRPRKWYFGTDGDRQAARRRDKTTNPAFLNPRFTPRLVWCIGFESGLAPARKGYWIRSMCILFLCWPRGTTHKRNGFIFVHMMYTCEPTTFSVIRPQRILQFRVETLVNWGCFFALLGWVRPTGHDLQTTHGCNCESRVARLSYAWLFRSHGIKWYYRSSASWNRELQNELDQIVAMNKK